MNHYYEHSLDRLTFPFLVTINQGQSPFSYHWHDEWELVRVLDGTVQVDMDNYSQELGPGDVFLLSGGIRHCYRPAGCTARRLAMLFQPELLLPQLRSLPPRINPFSTQWPQSAAVQIREAADVMYREFVTAQPGYELEICAQLSRVLSLAVRELPVLEREEEGTGAGELAQVFRYLSEHYREDINLSGCAAAVGYNPSYLSRMFRQKTGVSFHTYLCTMRIRQACWLLLYTREPVTAVAEQAGFQSIKTFNRAFRETQGCSPMEYRLREA